MCYSPFELDDYENELDLPALGTVWYNRGQTTPVEGRDLIATFGERAKALALAISKTTTLSVGQLKDFEALFGFELKALRHSDYLVASGFYYVASQLGESPVVLACGEWLTDYKALCELGGQVGTRSNRPCVGCSAENCNIATQPPPLAPPQPPGAPPPAVRPRPFELNVFGDVDGQMGLDVRAIFAEMKTRLYDFHQVNSPLHTHRCARTSALALLHTTRHTYSWQHIPFSFRFSSCTFLSMRRLCVCH
jgi:hypothetical protein